MGLRKLIEVEVYKLNDSGSSKELELKTHAA